MSSLHPQARIRHLPIPRGAGRGWNKPWKCCDCGLRKRSSDAIIAHWNAEHCPKPRVLTNVECVSVKVEGELP